jgi:hypothetical protein
MNYGVFWDVTPVNLVRNDVSEERIAAIVMVIRIAGYCHSDDGGDTFLGNVSSYKSHRPNIQGDGILHSHCHEFFSSYIVLTDWSL